MKQKDLFFELWQNRPHVSFIDDTPLGDEARAHYFFHILPKGLYQHYKFYSNNIIFTTIQQHIDWHCKTKDELLNQHHGWQKVFDLYETLEQEYHQRFHAHI